MNERDALLKAVCDHSDDDTPRLVFADWLQENGEEERAEFIRLQVHFAALHRGGVPTRIGRSFIGVEVEQLAGQKPEELRKLERAIWAEHQAAFRSELPQIAGVAWFSEFHRGFVERMTISSDSQLVRHANVIFSRVPIRHLEIRQFNAVDGFSELTHLNRLKTLHLSNSRADEALIRRLMQCDQLNESMLLFLNFGYVGTDMRERLRAKFGQRIL